MAGWVRFDTHQRGNLATAQSPMPSVWGQGEEEGV